MVHTVDAAEASSSALRAELPPYVREALSGLTPAQKRAVIAGYICDEPMRTIRSLQQKALFYLKIDSPNGRAGFMVLTPLGVTVQGILKGRSAATKASPVDAATPKAKG